MRFFKCILILLICIFIGGIFWLCSMNESFPSYVVLKCANGNSYRLQSVDIQALYERLIYAEKKYRESYEMDDMAFIQIEYPEFQSPGYMELVIYDQHNKRINDVRLCKHLPFTLFVPLAPLTSISDCIGEEEKKLFYRNQPEWNNEKNLIYKAIKDKEIKLLNYLIEQNYHRKRDMERPSPLDYARQMRFDDGVPILEEAYMNQ